MTEPKSQELLNQFVAEQSDAAKAIFDRYVARLLELARQRIGSKLKRRVDPEDIVQSAYRSFFLHAANEEYRLAQSGDLWRLLAGTTLNKLFGQIEKHVAVRRSVYTETHDATHFTELATREPAVVEMVAVTELLTLIMNGLSSEERLALEAMLRGQSKEEVAASLGKSERTVRRLYANLKNHFESQLLNRNWSKKEKRAQKKPPHAPLLFSDYVLEQLVGEGAMGKVYRGTEKSTGKTVAIKSLHKNRQTNDRAVAMFVQESQVLTKLSHPNLVGVKGLGQFPHGGYFMVMDFIEGESLQSRIASGPIPASEALSIVKQVSVAIQYAHDQGIVHCDIKPGNVMVNSEGRVVVTDFGFAFILGYASGSTRSNLGGTAGFIAPEVLQLQNTPTPVSDIYSIGALLRNLVTGISPAADLSHHSNTKMASGIEAICGRCMAKNPTDRYSTATELIDAIEMLTDA